MNKAILDRLAAETGMTGISEMLGEKLSSSDLNSLLLAVFCRKTERISPAGLLNAYLGNRFVNPSAVDCIAFREFTLEWLRAARSAGFIPVELSPVAPIGSCSVIGAVHQDKVVSALRGTEVVADATNVLALESAARRKQSAYPAESLHFSVAHRHLRAQEIPKVPGFSAHFGILGLSSAGRDTGGFQFEKENLVRHIRFYMTFLEENLQIYPVKIRLNALDPAKDENRLFQAVSSFLRASEPDWPVEIITMKQNEQAYYSFLQFKIVIPGPEGRDLEIADGGFTNWTQLLTGNRKERLLISGVGLELLYKMLNGLV